MSNISSALSTSLNAMQSKFFKKIDANGDGSVSKNEFISARPKGVSESQASSLFTKIDTSGTGSVTQDQLAKGMEANKPANAPSSSGNNLSSDILSTILQLLQGNGSASGANVSTASAGQDHDHDGDKYRPSASDMFSKMDANSDGAVSKYEFLAAKPKDVSGDQALKLYNSIDTQGNGSITLSQFEQSMQDGSSKVAGVGVEHHHHHSDNGDSPKSQNYDPLDTNKDGKVSITELLAGMTSKNSGNNSNSSNGSSSNDLLSNLTNAIKAYATQNKINLDQTFVAS